MSVRRVFVADDEMVIKTKTFNRMHELIARLKKLQHELQGSEKDKVDAMRDCIKPAWTADKEVDDEPDNQ